MNTEDSTYTQVSHKPTLFAEPVFHLGSFTVTNSLINTWIVVFIIILFCYFLRRSLREIPRGLQNFTELIFEKALELVDTVTGSREKSVRFFPIVFSLFIFILLNNYLGLLPGVGSIGYIASHEGHLQFIPLFRGATADLNTTLALSLFAIVATHFFGIITLGVWAHLNRFLNLRALLEIPKKIIREPTIIFVNPIKFFVGMVEIVGEIAKTISLSLRLFGNIFAGEVLLASMSAIFAYLTPIPFIFLELIVGIVQALVFAMLTLVFLSVLTTAEEH